MNIELKNSIITVRHSQDNSFLFQKNAVQGDWDRIWDAIKTLPTETVEEAAEKCINPNNPLTHKKAFIAGASWQKQQSQIEIDKLKELNRELAEALERALNDFKNSRWTDETYSVIETTLNKAKNI